MQDFVLGNFAICYENEVAAYYQDLPIEWINKIARYCIKAKVVYEFEDEIITDSDKMGWFDFINFAGTPHLKK